MKKVFATTIFVIMIVAVLALWILGTGDAEQAPNDLVLKEFTPEDLVQQAPFTPKEQSELASYSNDELIETLDKKENYYGNTSGNLVNRGIVTQQGDWMFFCAGSEDDNFNIYKMKLDGSNKKKLNNDSCSDINVVGDWIYYRNISDFSSIYKMRLDGSDRTKLNDDHSYMITVVGDWIYYLEFMVNIEYNIYKMRTDGSNKTKLNNDTCRIINVVGDWIYYGNSIGDYDEKMYKMRTDGSNRTKLNNYDAGTINVVGDWIYYINWSDSRRIYKIRTDGSDVTQLSDFGGVASINVAGDWIYYLHDCGEDCGEDSWRRGYIHKIRIDGSDKTRLNYEISHAINVVGDWIYYINRSDNSRIYKMRIDGSEQSKVEVDDIPNELIKGTIKVTWDFARVRQSPWGEVIGQLDRGKTTDVFGSRGDSELNTWYRIKYNGMEGYVHEENVSVQTDSIINELSGRWTLDVDKTQAWNEESLFDAFGSSIKLGYGMEINPDGSFLYYIATGHGGTGSYSYSLPYHKLITSIITYEDPREFKIDIYIHKDENGEPFLIMHSIDAYGSDRMFYKLVWKKAI